MLLSALLASTAPGLSPGVPSTQRPFQDITAEAGITFRLHSSPDKKYILESMSGGVALFDFDNDGLLDIYLVDSPTVATSGDKEAARSALYRNRGNGKFEDVTDKAGVGQTGAWRWGISTTTGGSTS